jgi:hypothetical protein
MVFQLDSLFTLNFDDLYFLRRQVNAANIKIVRYDINGQPIYGYVDINNFVRELGLLGTFNPLDPSIYVDAPIRVQSVLDPLGTRTSSGVFNNLIPGRFTWGSTNQPFLNLTNANYSNYLGQNINNPAFNPGRFGPRTIGFQEFFQTAANGQTIANGVADSSALYADPFKTVVDYTPRMITQTISSQQALNRLKIATDIDNSFGKHTPFMGSQRTDEIGQWEDIQNYRARDQKGNLLDADPNQAGIQVIKTGQSLLLDARPVFDATRIYQNGTSKDTTGILADVELGTTLDAAGIPTTITVNGTVYNFSKYINTTNFSIQPDLSATDQAIANELLLRSVGNHYIAGDGRLNENFGLTTIHHVFHSNHEFQLNSLISTILKQQSQDFTKSYAHSWQVAVEAQPDAQLAQGVLIVNNHYEDAYGNYVTAKGSLSWNQEKLFDAARFINQTEYQHIVFEYARFVSPDIPKFETYNPDINADISLDYAQAAFRYGHSQLRETIDYLDPNGSLTAQVQKFALKAAFLNPDGFSQVGPGAIALGMARQLGNETDEFVTPALQQSLLGQPLDLAAINITRGRDLGLPTLNEARKQLHDALVAEREASPNPPLHRTLKVEDLTPYISWNDFGNHMIHPASLVNFIAAYSFDGDLAKAQAIIGLDRGTILEGSAVAQGFTKQQATNFLNGGDQGFNKIDLWIGGLAEKHVSGGILGTTFNTIFADQMERLQNGDRLYYLFRIDSEFQEARGLLTQIESEDFKDLVERNTGARHLQGDIFEYADNHLEFSEIAVSDPKSEHKYGGLAAVAQKHLGVFSTSGGSIGRNGTIVTVDLLQKSEQNKRK